MKLQSDLIQPFIIRMTSLKMSNSHVIYDDVIKQWRFWQNLEYFNKCCNNCLSICFFFKLGKKAYNCYSYNISDGFLNYQHGSGKTLVQIWPKIENLIKSGKIGENGLKSDFDAIIRIQMIQTRYVPSFKILS